MTTANINYESTIAELNARIAALEAEIADHRSGAIHRRERQCIVIKWHIGDVKEVRPDLDDDQAFAVLTAVKDKHDANYGVCWQTITDTADDLYPEE